MATEKDGDELHALKKSKTVAIILLLVFYFSIISVNAQTVYPNEVVLGGMPFGLKIFTNGVVVIKINGDNTPAKKAGIKINDIITKADNEAITSNEQLKEIIENSDGETIEITLTRGEKTLTKILTPIKDESNLYAAGMWVRDSTAGIGTITYFDKSSKTFGALGHGICDKDTAMLLPIRDGEILSATINSYQKADANSVGGLNGYFDSEKIGEIKVNNDYGIYGVYDKLTNKRTVKVAKEEEIKCGKATIVTTINGQEMKEYEIEIEKLNLNKTSGQNMIIRVTDEELLEKTGGIVQGMSGSPIIQDKKLVGAVTHVFINNPEKGYGISISNMLQNNALVPKFNKRIV